MAGKDTKAALLLALAPKEGDSPVKPGEDKEGDADSEDLMSAIADKDGPALKAAIRRICMSCMSEEGDEGES